MEIEKESESQPHIIQSALPEGIAIEDGKYGRCLKATKHFKKGELMYKGSCQLVAGVTSFTLHITDVNGKLSVFEVDTLNSVRDFDNVNSEKRQLYGFDGFMNHSCDSNIICPATERTEDKMSYDSFALKDIAPGDEITCDYAIFDYECDGHAIEVCGCGSPLCRGSMRGFKHLTFEQKLKLVPHADREIVLAFAKDEPRVKLVDCKLPDGVGLVETGADCKYLVAGRDFEEGELVFVNEVIIETDKTVTYIMHVNGQHIVLDSDTHFLFRQDYMEVLGFDIFMDHSCEPSTRQEYISKTQYSVYAARSIAKGDKLTCDYGLLDNTLEKQENIITSKFECTCGSANCRGTITA